MAGEQGTRGSWWNPGIKGAVFSILAMLIGVGIGGATTAKPGESVANAQQTPTVTVTQTVQFTPPPPAAYKPIQRLAGRGKKQTDPIAIPAAAKRWRICYDFRGDTNAIINLKNAEGKLVDGVLNEIGQFKDCSVRYEPVGASYVLEIQGGTWTVTVDITG